MRLDVYDWIHKNAYFSWLLFSGIFFLSSILMFNKITGIDEIAIFGSIVQGMSAILSVSIAVIIFRIQSLENRNANLEETTLNYIYNMIGWTNPRWDDALVRQITEGRIRDRYYRKLVDVVHRNRYETLQDYEKI